MQSIVSAWTVAYKYRIAGNFQGGKIFVIEQYVVISWIIFSWLLLALQVKVGKVASFVGKIFVVKPPTTKTTNIVLHENYPLWQNNYALFSAYYAFEHCPKFSLLCPSKEPIMPHIDVIIFSAVSNKKIISFTLYQQEIISFGK